MNIMEKEQRPPLISPQEKEYPLGELKGRESEREQVKEEIDALFNRKLHPETLRHLASQLGELHKRFATLIEFGEARPEDEKGYIEAKMGWRKGPFPLEKWREKLAWAVPHPSGTA